MDNKQPIFVDITPDMYYLHLIFAGRYEEAEKHKKELLKQREEFLKQKENNPE